MLLRLAHRPRRALTPDRIGPGGIGGEAGDDVDMELGHLIAEGGDIHLVRLEGLLHQRRGPGDLLDQRGAIRGWQVMDLPEVRARRHQDDPGKAGVVHQQQTAERPVAEGDGVGGEARVQGEGVGHGRTLQLPLSAVMVGA